MYSSKNKNKLNEKYISYNRLKNNIPNYDKDLDLISIAEWIACGFFLGNGNFTKRRHSQEKFINNKKHWYYQPRDISFSSAVEEFTHIFENLISNNIGRKKLFYRFQGVLIPEQ